jgi:AraC family transcriptional regulator
MEENFKEIQGKLENQLNLRFLRKSAEIYIGSGLNICLTNEGMSLPKGQHTHNTFEFILPISYSFATRIEGCRLMAEQNKIFTINSEHAHGPDENLEDFRFLCLEVENDYMNELSMLIYQKPKICFTNESFTIGNEFLSPIWTLLKEHRSRYKGYELVIQGLQYQIAVNLTRHVRHNLQNREEYSQNSRRVNINRVLDFLKENWDKEFSLETIAEMADLSVFHFIRVFKTQTGRTPHEFIIKTKIDKAKELLVTNSKSITEVCFSCGFNNLSHFADTFKRQVGITPSKYKSMMKNDKSFLPF